jgi:cation diffusion facilitator CzcD-associated flavoprotein CzcO
VTKAVPVNEQAASLGTSPDQSGIERRAVVVIGAGISGILVGIKLLDAGVTDFTILEKADDLGGTWRDNVYPGVSCDVATHLYVYSFLPNPSWRSRFTPGEEIWDYYRRAARKFGVTGHMRFNEEVTHGRWDGEGWQLTTARGTRLFASVVVTAAGRLVEPTLPEIPGLEDFEGPVLHTARWDQAVETKAKRVGLVGNGSSGTQLLVALEPDVAQLTLFQRTPQWILPVPNLPIPLRRRLALRFIPGKARKNYLTLQSGTEERGIDAMGTKEQRQSRDEQCLAGLASVQDPELRAKLTPDYEPGCKRMVISGSFYAAVQSPRVEVVSEGIDHVEHDAVITADGQRHEIEVLVLATGFDGQRYLRPMQLQGLDGVELDELWRDGTPNYRSVAIPHMPNWFMVNGPYSPAGGASVVGIAEAQTGYVMQLVAKALTEGVALSPRAEPADEWLQGVRKAASETVWGTGGCQSWYLDQEGVPTMNPIPLSVLQEEMRTPELDDFLVAPLTPRGER